MQSRPWFRFLLGLALLAGVIALVFYRRKNPPPVESFPRLPPIVKSTLPPESLSPAPSPTSQPSTERLALPTTEDLRREVHDNPHAPPPSYIRFAQELGRRADEATKSPENANRLFSEMENCADARETATPLQVQALCLSTAAELAEKYPKELGSRNVDLQKTANPEAVRLLNSLNTIGSR